MARIVRAPIYQQLNAALRALITGGDYAADSKFLTEREVAERFEVSRPTANKALSSLVAEGLLDFRKGVGTFVRPGLGFDLRELVSFTARAEGAGKQASTRVLSFARCDSNKAPAAARDALNTGTVFALRRLRLADNQPVILEQRYVAAALCPGLTKAQSAGSIYAAFTDTHGLHIGGADQQLRAVALNAKDAELMDQPAGSPALEVTAVGYTGDQQALWWERTLYRADAYAFTVHLGPPQATGAVDS
ncbi:MAG: GntR family transcriptional regulator [Planctomycetota bacterium]|jgi:GntR family transcriptional regulator|nr:GntR family transcriptional regulator [Planctomycetota bacterium]